MGTTSCGGFECLCSDFVFTCTDFIENPRDAIAIEPRRMVLVTDGGNVDCFSFLLVVDSQYRQKIELVSSEDRRPYFDHRACEHEFCGDSSVAGSGW